MFRMWGKLMKDNHLLRDTVICISDYSLSRTQMVFDSLDSICYEFNLEKPMWLDSTVKDFKYHDKPVLHRTILSSPLTLIFLRYRL